jgi:lysozyme family protein
LQQALGVTADGAIGPGTLAAIHAADGKQLVEKFTEMKENFYKSLPTFGTFGTGWLRRVAEVKVIADTMIG